MRNKLLGTRPHGYHPFGKLVICLSGFRYAILYDISVAYKIVLSIMVLISCIYLHKWVDFIIIFLSTGMMLICEMINTATEVLCDYIQSEEDNQIKIIKDISAAAAGLSIFIWLIVVIVEISHLL